jgi:hypothetical protein
MENSRIERNNGKIKILANISSRNGVERDLFEIERLLI